MNDSYIENYFCFLFISIGCIMSSLLFIVRSCEMKGEKCIDFRELVFNYSNCMDV